jgi:iron complex outermembrane receptor protein
LKMVGFCFALPCAAAFTVGIAFLGVCGAALADADIDAKENSRDSPQQGLAEVVVTAERRPANEQTVPVAIATLTSDDLRASRLRNGAVGNESSVAVYLDGIYIPSSSAAVFDLENVNQIEVRKGPQRTLFGRSATGGVIQITTRASDPTPAAQLRVGPYWPLLRASKVRAKVLASCST